MATGNLFLGTARRKLGDVVIYRRDGVQQARVRVRTIANPKSEGQALQRNYLAPVAKFYAPLAGVLETSWEGLNRSKSYTAFLQRNIKLARELGVYLPKGAPFTPMPYQLSYGVLPPLNITLRSQDDVVVWNFATNATVNISVSGLTSSLLPLGYLEGDQLTFISVIQNGDNYRPTWGRVILSSSDTRVVSDIIPSVGLTFVSSTGFAFTKNGQAAVGAAVIVSRYSGGKWLRSTQSLVCRESFVDYLTSLEQREAALASYRGNSSLVSSDVYLNGSTYNGGSSSSAIAIDIHNADNTILFYVTPQSLRADNGLLVVDGQNVANGMPLSWYIRCANTRSDNYGMYLTPSSTWAQTAPAAALVHDLADLSSPFGQWLIQNGISDEIM